MYIDGGGAVASLRPAVQDAIDADVKVVVGTTIEGLKGASSGLNVDFRQANIPAGEYMAEQVPDGGKIGIIRCIIGNPATDSREAGFRQGLKDADAKVEVVARADAECLPEKARSITENMLTAHPDLKGIYSDTDVAGMGAIEALEAANKDLVLIGHDGQKAALEALAGGRVIDATVRFDYEDIGAVTVRTAIQAAQGEEVPAVIPIPQFPLITQENAQEVLDNILELERKYGSS